MRKGRNVLHKLHGDSSRLSRENAFEDERWNASISIYRRGLQKLSRLKAKTSAGRH